jgi:hypothetical protein
MNQSEGHPLTAQLQAPKGDPRLFEFWWACVEAAYRRKHHGRWMPHDELVLHFCEQGVEVTVFARDIRMAVATLEEIEDLK